MAAMTCNMHITCDEGSDVVGTPTRHARMHQQCSIWNEVVGSTHNPPLEPAGHRCIQPCNSCIGIRRRHACQAGIRFKEPNQPNQQTAVQVTTKPPCGRLPACCTASPAVVRVASLHAARAKACRPVVAGVGCHKLPPGTDRHWPLEAIISSAP